MISASRSAQEQSRKGIQVDVPPPRPVFLLGGEKGKHSPWMRWEDLAVADPDAIVVLPCGFDIERTRAEMPALTDRPGWADLEAVKAGRVFLTDGNQYFNRPGPRIAESLEILAEILHPESFDFGHEGAGWDRL